MNPAARTLIRECAQAALETRASSQHKPGAHLDTNSYSEEACTAHCLGSPSMKQLAHVRHNHRLKAEHAWVLRTIYWKLLCSASSVRISSPKARRSAKAPRCPAQSQSWARSAALRILTPRQILTSDPPSEYVCSITLKGTGASTFPVGFHVQNMQEPLAVAGAS